MSFQPGDTESKPYTFDAAGIMAFAYASGDMNPLHHDPEAAARSRFKSLIASGAQMTAVLMGFGATLVSRNHEAVGLEFNVAFKRAIPAGTETILTSTIVSAEPHPKLAGTLIAFQSSIASPADGSVYVSATGKAVVWDKLVAAPSS